MKPITLALLLILALAIPALARTHPDPSGYLPIDAAAIAPYPFAESIHTERFQRWHYRHRRKAIGERGGGRVRTSHGRIKPVRKAGLSPRSPVASGQKQPAIRNSEEPAREIAQTPETALALAVAGVAVTISRVLHTPARLLGILTIGDKTFRYGSGGYGWSVPTGSYLVTPESIGSWGARHDAIGVAGSEIFDRRLRRYREGIELHRDLNGEFKTEGCVAISPWSKFKHELLAMIDHVGKVYLNISPLGAEISPSRDLSLTMADIGMSPEYKQTARREYKRHVRYARRWRHRHYASR